MQPKEAMDLRARENIKSPYPKASCSSENSTAKESPHEPPNPGLTTSYLGLLDDDGHEGAAGWGGDLVPPLLNPEKQQEIALAPKSVRYNGVLSSSLGQSHVNEIWDVLYSVSAVVSEPPL